MILQREVQEKSAMWGVPSDTVDKDYVLGHFLNNFFAFGNNRKMFVFKGGTSLRKCYFPNYRFSEDLDFTLLNRAFEIDQSFLEEISRQCEANSGIRFYVKSFENKRFKNEEKGYKCTIGFWGANHSRNTAPAPKERWTSKIEIDISFDELVLFPVNQFQIIHPYSDASLIGINTIPVYSLEEVLTEKVRSFFQRSYKAPRDFYDVWYLLNQVQWSEKERLKENLLQKVKLKNKFINPELFSDTPVLEHLAKHWVNTMGNQLSQQDLPVCNEVWAYLMENSLLQFLLSG